MWQREKQEAGMGNRLGSWLRRFEGRGEGSPKCLNNLVKLSKCDFSTLIEHWPVGSVLCTPHKNHRGIVPFFHENLKLINMIPVSLRGSICVLYSTALTVVPIRRIRHPPKDDRPCPPLLILPFGVDHLLPPPTTLLKSTKQWRRLLLSSLFGFYKQEKERERKKTGDDDNSFVLIGSRKITNCNKHYRHVYLFFKVYI